MQLHSSAKIIPNINITDMKKLFLITILGLAVGVVSCNGQTPKAEQKTAEKNVQQTVIDIQELTPPKELLAEVSFAKAAEEYVGYYSGESVVVTSKGKNEIVPSAHPLFDAVRLAYSEHRPLVLTPDAVWLVICQGFSCHVQANAEALRDKFVDFDGKKRLEVESNADIMHISAAEWEKFFPEFTRQIATYTGKELTDLLSCDFSTTDKVAYTASQISIMSAMQSYFEYYVIEICGIPQAILEGTPEDWQHLVDKAHALRQYDLDWWMDELEPVLKKFAAAAKGEVDKTFWMSAYKRTNLNPKKEYMCGETPAKYNVDGWIVKFYPYFTYHKEDYLRNDFSPMEDTDFENLPSEMSTAPLSFKPLRGDDIKLTLWAGAMGLIQDHETFAVRPEIGWFVSHNGVLNKR